ncbi:MAG: hypothetical protein EAX95_08280 [Candidatus Thorarchaeota archaeon]|nr:hypothetical protein [Candidatus Thorarchaeota archaeon]
MQAKSKKALTLLLASVAIICCWAYFGLPAPTTYQGWMVRQYDEVQYNVESRINAGNTFVTEFLSHYGIESKTTLKIRVGETPSTTNITSIAEGIYTFTGMVAVERQVGQDWVPLESSLPFFLPVGYWSEIETGLNEFAPLNLKEEWWGEMTLAGSVSSEPNLEFFMAWEFRDGVLQGLTFNATSSNRWDFVRLALSSQKLAYETNIDYIVQTMGGNAPRVLFMLGFLGPVCILPLVWHKEIGARVFTPLTGSVEEQLEEYGRSYLFLWSLGLLIAVITGLFGSLYVSESILPMFGSYLLAILLASGVLHYRIKRIEWDEKPSEIIQYAFASVTASISGLFIFAPGGVTTPLAYSLPLVMMLGTLVFLIVMHPLRNIRSRIKNQKRSGEEAG